MKKEDIKRNIIKKVEELLSKDTLIPEIPDVDQNSLYKLNVRYPLIPPFAYANIYWDPVREEIAYDVEEPYLDPSLQRLIDSLKRKIIDQIQIDLEELDRKSAEEYLFDRILHFLKIYGIKLDEHDIAKVFYYIWRDLIGLEEIEPLMHDPFIEDISCDGVGIPIFVNHRKYGSLRTNIVFDNLEKLERFVVKLAQKSGRYISYAEPLLDATLPDGSRVNATYSSDITTKGPTFTIRKFRRDILTIVDLIKSNTISIEGAAYLWWAIENRANILIAGETAAGKTTMLNAIAMFIHPNDKIVSIEDTREIRLFHENWVPAVAREGFGEELGSKRIGTVTMFDLLKESFRQRPDYIIVGEIRGEEAYVLFQGMASGHAALSTMHADSIYAIVERLSTPPINLPEDLINLLDLVVFMSYVREFGPSARRVREISEIRGIKGRTVDQNKYLVWNPVNDSFEISTESYLLEKLRLRRGNVSDPEESIAEKKKVLEYLVKKNIRDPKELQEYINMYYLEKEVLMEMIENE